MAEKGITDLVKAMRRAGVVLKRPSGDRTERKGAGDKPTVFNQPLDSWEPRFRPVEPISEKVPEKIEAKAPLKGLGTPVVYPEEDTGFETRTAKRMKANKVRTVSLSFSVSPEEKELLRAYCAEHGLSLSPWARGVLFKSMGRKPPVRPKRID